MIVKDLDGNEREATLTTGHPDSSYGQMVLVIDGQAYSHFQVTGMDLVYATDEELAALARAGYSFRED